MIILLSSYFLDWSSKFLKEFLPFRSYKLCFKSCKKSSDCPIGPKKEPQVCLTDGSCKDKWVLNYFGSSHKYNSRNYYTIFDISITCTSIIDAHLTVHVQEDLFATQMAPVNTLVKIIQSAWRQNIVIKKKKYAWYHVPKMNNVGKILLA